MSKVQISVRPPARAEKKSWSVVIGMLDVEIAFSPSGARGLARRLLRAAADASSYTRYGYVDNVIDLRAAPNPKELKY
jgi:hypothetical protein